MDLTPIFLDHAATTPLAAEVQEAMLPWLDAGNPSSLHAPGRAARHAVDQAREALAEAMQAEFGEVIFTGGGTEAAVLALVGVARAARGGNRRRILVGAAEHHCVLHQAEILGELGLVVETVPCDRYARPDLNALEDALRDDVLLVALMHANNEFGTITDLAPVRGRTERVDALLAVDAVQTFGRLAWPVEADLAWVAGHKVNGPKGVGAVRIRAGTRIKPTLAGGGQERELRAGTENVAGIVGFGAAVRRFPLPSVAAEAGRLRTGLEKLGAVATLAAEIECLSGHVHVRFPGQQAEPLLIRLDRLGIAAGSGAACSSGSLEPSHVMQAAGYTEAESREGLRFTLGPETNAEEIDLALARIAQARAVPSQD